MVLHHGRTSPEITALAFELRDLSAHAQKYNRGMGCF